MLERTIIIALVMILASGCAQQGSDIWKPAPDFSLLTLDGRQISLSSYHGKVVVLDFWATWCTPCRVALPHLQSLATDTQLARKGLVVLAIDEGEQIGTIRPFIDQNRYTFTVMQDTNGLAQRAYDLPELPSTIIIGRDGRIQATFTEWTQDTARLIDNGIAGALDKMSTSQPMEVRP